MDYLTLFQKFKLKFFLQESFLFLSVQIIGLLTAQRLFKKMIPVHVSTVSSVKDFLLAFFLATLFIILLLKISKGNLFFKFLFYLTLFLGLEIFFSSFFSFSFSLAFFFILLRFFFPKIWIHNLVLVLGISGIGARFGLSLSILSSLIILSLLSFYDIIAVYKTKHMVRMFQGLMKGGALFAVILPEKYEDLSKDVKGINPGEGIAMLGTGDLVLPLMAASSALFFNLISSIYIITGAWIGLIFLHFLFIRQKERRPLPALPPLALGSILGFLISLL